MAEPTDAQLIRLAQSNGIVTGENLRRGNDYLFRSMGTPSHVFGTDLVAFARAVLAAYGVTPTHGGRPCGYFDCPGCEHCKAVKP